MGETENDEFSLKRKLPSALDEHSMDERIHETLVKQLYSKFPRLDPLMCSVLLKCPPDLLDDLISKPEMWVVEPQTTTLITSAVTISDPEPPSSPRSVLDSLE